MSKRHNEALIKLAILKGWESGIPQASQIYDIDEEDLLEYQREFVKAQGIVLNPVPIPQEPEEPGLWQRIHSSFWYETSFKFFITLMLMGIFWAMPYVLEHLLDPLTNTIVWTGFTAAYYLAFGSLGVDLLFLVMHRGNFKFFNRYEEKGVYDYESLLRGPTLSDYEKCVINQQKYLVYLALFCVLVWGLLSQMHPTGN